MANEEVYYSALHYAAKAKKYAEQTKDVKEEADTAIALVEGFGGTVDAAKTAIINLSDEKKTDIRNEGATQVTAVSAEGTKQVGLVNTASATAQQQIAAQSANFVTLDGNQTISGQKTFAGSVVVPEPTKDDDSQKPATTHWVRNVQPLINVISATSGTVTLAANKVYTMSISGATTFTLPTNVDTSVFNQIKVMAKVTGTPTITWGTTNFFNKTTPEIEAGSYDFYFDYDNGLGAWVCGVMAKGTAS